MLNSIRNWVAVPNCNLIGKIIVLRRWIGSFIPSEKQCEAEVLFEGVYWNDPKVLNQTGGRAINLGLITFTSPEV